MSETEQARERARRTALVKEAGGILPIYSVFYERSVLYSASRAHDAFMRYEHGLDSGATADEIVSSVHEALSHAASLSRFFWPARLQGVASARGERLRRHFGIDESSPLYGRELRNALEHFDERLDEYLLWNDAGYFFPDAAVDSHELADEAIGHIFKLVDPCRQIFVVLGQKFYFDPIRREVDRILEFARNR
ncbi:hypothetical protein [Bradyrhizobium sp. cf659]|uniref:hypothetical protein n=1 Tax=Bradyrhizobium sp. cf659 TaxID=1761771 RepID=UPI0008E11410|nr:hypothetical protein [Bradyrhizobium sp. cf659]SFJ53738.1 hypothetical protein SAMN04487925_108271 [Bradyrhizobium sp. cf659]